LFMRTVIEQKTPLGISKKVNVSGPLDAFIKSKCVQLFLRQRT
jgi:hypothetical protein